MLSPESALILASRRVATPWNTEQLRLYAALEGVELGQLRADHPAEPRPRPTVTPVRDSPAARPVPPSPPEGTAVTSRARSWTP